MTLLFKTAVSVALLKEAPSSPMASVALAGLVGLWTSLTLFWLLCPRALKWTFLSCSTARGYQQARFLEGTNEIKADVLSGARIHWNGITTQATAWVSEG